MYGPLDSAEVERMLKRSKVCKGTSRTQDFSPLPYTLLTSAEV